MRRELKMTGRGNRVRLSPRIFDMKWRVRVKGGRTREVEGG